MTIALAIALIIAGLIASALALDNFSLAGDLKHAKKLIDALEKRVGYFALKRRIAESEADRLLGLYQAMRTENDKLQAKLAKFDRKRGTDGRIIGKAK